MSVLNNKNHVFVVAIIICVALTVCVLQFSVTAAALEKPTDTMGEINAYLDEHGEEYYAYMILDEADESLKPIILEARWRIISNSTWVDDDLNGHIEDEMGNIIEIVPHFHDIFPADWEIEIGRELY